MQLRAAATVQYKLRYGNSQEQAKIRALEQMDQLQEGGRCLLTFLGQYPNTDEQFYSLKRSEPEPDSNTYSYVAPKRPKNEEVPEYASGQVGLTSPTSKVSYVVSDTQIGPVDPREIERLRKLPQSQLASRAPAPTPLPYQQDASQYYQEALANPQEPAADLYTGQYHPYALGIYSPEDLK